MTNRTTSSRSEKRQRTASPNLASDKEKPVAVSPAGNTPTLPDNFNGDLSMLPDFNLNAQELPSSQIARLPTAVTNSLLAYAAARDPYINSIVAHQHDLERARERARIIKFTRDSQRAKKMLNTEYAVSDIGKWFDDILKTVEKARGSDCSYGTRKNAVKAMIQIMRHMVVALNDVHYHKTLFMKEADEMEKKLLEMMTHFDGDELARLDEEGWTDEVRELIQETGGYPMYGRLNEVVKMLEGDYEEDGEEDEEVE
ncbi:hypothetical protein NEUTE1DRAFT_112565 [Neurospora tetrasperma FGSC 2508]|uniref:Uncharacterized protein n=1 Tax=Neurospora tetrasperma (strain FGSC 2508 / ATCC MYA-4615 / P0657) TaxID=510951 RepID=F8MVU7_NEUT8|nr:uncharacterized protein NEUTE1DRAFT_112565 [Neurospora tetrasperma FGSC 2508]EGO53995.1 hypothetical protein NEUTE1DRAFT_112565 [Neurospora tetrasperma FGSC 2508]EGZ68584.1 hypothetical protein NEUTE2DRAFT_142160 [Neurospora tetrasperma FGSC 2509]